jgi:hypothetical protein
LRLKERHVEFNIEALHEAAAHAVNKRAQDVVAFKKLAEGGLKIAPHLAPNSKDHQYLLKPTLRHPDINPRNIFVDTDLKISSLIDWQHCSAVPLILSAGVPEYFANFGDVESLQIKQPELPKDISILLKIEREEAIETFRRRHLHFYYFAGCKRFNPFHYNALRLKTTRLKQRLCFNASAPWHGNNIPLKAQLIEATQKWQSLKAESVDSTPGECPISF